MEQRKRKWVLLGFVGVLLAMATLAPHPRAEISILTHEKTDLNPHRMQAAIDLGLVGISILYTWTSSLTR